MIKTSKFPTHKSSVSEIEVPEFNAHVIANRVASALERGVHFRRAGFWALNQVMEAGALGCEIVISGKLTTERARFEKFRAGHYPIVGEPALVAMKTAEAHVQLKPGMIGVRVKIMPPDAYFPDKVTIIEPKPEDETIVVTQEAPTPAPAHNQQHQLQPSSRNKSRRTKSSNSSRNKTSGGKTVNGPNHAHERNHTK